MADWEINKTLGKCYGTGVEFEAGREYFAALVDTPEGFERRDYSVDFWQSDQPKVYCHWKTKMPLPNEKKRKLFISDEMLMVFFERLGAETDQEKVDFRFVLTLVLMRKRKLKYDSTRITGGDEIWTVRVAGENRSLEVVNPRLTEEQVEQLSSQIGQILQVDL